MLLTMTASRSGEIRGMCWEEVNLFEDREAQKRGYLGIWTRPAERMKAKREHRVPITAAMYELICDTNDQTGLVFKSGKLTTLSDMTLSALMKRMHACDEDGFVDQRSCTSSSASWPTLNVQRLGGRNWAITGGRRAAVGTQVWLRG
jgi:integrase